MNSRVLGRRAFLSTVSGAVVASALGRIPQDGTLVLAWPFRISAPDPHDLFDPMAAFFRDAVFDTLYRTTRAGAPYPSLASDLPRVARAGRLIVPLRPGLRVASGSPLQATDVAGALERARRGAAAGVLAGFDRFVGRDGDAEIETRGDDREALASALASPATAILKLQRNVGLSGTGALSARLVGGALELRRNEFAARGPSFLRRVVVRHARDLAASLRAFEAGDTDVGWLGAGLHEPRKGARRLDGPKIGWVVLRAGAAAGSWGAPGVAEHLVSELSADRLGPFGLQATRALVRGRGYRGPPGELLVDADSAYMVEVARTVAESLTRPSHGLSVAPVPKSEFEARRKDRRYLFMLDWVCRVGPTPRAAQLSLLAAEHPRLARRPPKHTPATVDEVARKLTLGVVGEVSITGYVAPRIRGLEHWELGDAWVQR